MNKDVVQKEERFTVEKFTFIGDPPHYAVLKLKSETTRGVRISVRVTELARDAEILSIRGVNRFFGTKLRGELHILAYSGWISYL